jgi:hypothetical protein
LVPFTFAVVAGKTEEKISIADISRVTTVLVPAFIVVLVVIHSISSSCTDTTLKDAVKRGEEGHGNSQWWQLREFELWGSINTLWCIESKVDSANFKRKSCSFLFLHECRMLHG